MNFEAVLTRLRGVRRYRDAWMARCPAHEDRVPSLGIREGRNGRVLLHCFAGCTVEAICAAIGIRVTELFAGACAEREAVPVIVRQAERELSMLSLRARLTPSERDRPVSVVFADPANPDIAIARALALTVEGEIVQVTLKAVSNASRTG
jgi:hypothetical protein